MNYVRRVFAALALTAVALAQATQVAGTSSIQYLVLCFIKSSDKLHDERCAGKLVDGIYVVRYKGKDECGGTVLQFVLLLARS